MSQVTNHHKLAPLIATLLIAGNIGCVAQAQSNDDIDDDTPTESCEWKVQYYNNIYPSGFWTLNALYWNSCTGKIYHLYDPVLSTGRFNVQDYELDVNITVTEITVAEMDTNNDDDGDTSTESCEWKAQYSKSRSEEVLNALFWNSCTGKVYHLYDQVLSTEGDDGEEVELDVDITVTEITVTEADANNDDDGDTSTESCEWIAQYNDNFRDENLNALFWNSCTGKVYHLYDQVLSTEDDDGEEVELDVDITVTEITVTEMDTNDDGDASTESCEWIAQQSTSSISSSPTVLNALFWNSCTGKVFHLYDPDLSTYVGEEVELDVDITVTEITIAEMDTTDDDDGDTPTESCEWIAEYNPNVWDAALNALFWNSCTGKVYHLYDPDFSTYDGEEAELDVDITVTEITVTETDANDDDSSTESCEWKAQYNSGSSAVDLNALFWNSCTGKVFHLYDPVLYTEEYDDDLEEIETELDVDITVSEITVTEIDANDDDDMSTESCEWKAQYNTNTYDTALNALFWNSCAGKVYHLYDPVLSTEDDDGEELVLDVDITVTEINTNDDDDTPNESCAWIAQNNNPELLTFSALNALFWNSCSGKIYHLYDLFLSTGGYFGYELELDIDITVTEITVTEMDTNDDDDTSTESCEWIALYSTSRIDEALNALYWNSCTGKVYHLYDPFLHTAYQGEEGELDVDITVTEVDTNIP